MSEKYMSKLNYQETLVAPESIPFILNGNTFTLKATVCIDNWRDYVTPEPMMEIEFIDWGSINNI